MAKKTPLKIYASVLATPTGLIVTRRGVAVQLNWTDNTEPDFGLYRIYCRRMAVYSLTTLIAETVATQFTDMLTEAGIAYYYSISALTCDGLYESAQCPEVLMPTKADW